jgi:hypothetical protein
MSLKFLAVGQTLAGLRSDKSPFAVRKENQLPTFPSTPRFAGKQAPAPCNAMVQTDFLHKSASEESEIISPAPLPVPANGDLSLQPPIKRKRGWLSFIRLRWFRAQPSKADLVQSELSLEKVRVIRNDLADSDLQLVLKKKKKAKSVFSAAQENNALPRQGWTELTARLFELGQK